jgi:hypothetical protein
VNKADKRNAPLTTDLESSPLNGRWLIYNFARGHGMTVPELLCSRQTHVLRLRREAYRKLVECGWTFREIGVLFNRSPETVSAAVTS